MTKPKAKNTPTLRFKGFEGAWEEKRLGKLGVFSGGGTPDTNIKEYWEGEIPWVSSSDIYEDSIKYINVHRFISEEAITKSATKKIVPNSILIISRVGVGKLAVTNKELCTSQDFCNFTPTKDSPHFIAYLLSSDKSKILSLCQGTSIKGITTKELQSLKLDIPTLPEQEKIAGFLGVVDARIEQVRHALELTERYKRGLMQQLFSQQRRFTQPNGTPYPDWEEKRLGDIATFFSGGTPTSTNKGYYRGTIPFIGSGKIGSPEVEQYISDEALNNSSAKLINNGDLLYALYGATSGEVAISPITGAINQAVLCIRTNENINYLYQYLRYSKENIVN